MPYFVTKKVWYNDLHKSWNHETIMDHDQKVNPSAGSVGWRIFPFEFSLNQQVLSNLFLSSYKGLRIVHQFLVLLRRRLTRFLEKRKKNSHWSPNVPLPVDRFLLLFTSFNPWANQWTKQIHVWLYLEPRPLDCKKLENFWYKSDSNQSYYH